VKDVKDSGRMVRVSIKEWYLSKTFWFNVLAVIVAVAMAFGYTGEMPKEWATFIPAIIAIINIILRLVTRQPLKF
jgi:hypothetical protein